MWNPPDPDERIRYYLDKSDPFDADFCGMEAYVTGYSVRWQMTIEEVISMADNSF